MTAIGGDAPNNMSTELCFNPPDGPFGDDNVVEGVISHKFDEDWIVIELSEGKEYTITVDGRFITDSNDDDTPDSGDLKDSVVKLLDAKGNEIMMNDDYKDANGVLQLGSRIKFTPEAGSGTQKYFISVSAYNANPGSNNMGGYEVSVKEVAVLPVGESGDIEGKMDFDDKLTGTDLAETILGFSGDDTLDGGGGNDTIHGGAGHDLLIGGKGADVLDGGAGHD